ncbi:hypothetical protein RGU12_14415 [Fredinandcohnia sp. QZ13]|uniref:hypothetical protein n=1 Tax=Fredinandcohnia sp. QZ13 TaxID=3073144 RepID=UPI0028535563|nr:hypothetical protein [Fredinandcohnia sp. QZ13]MDR4888705.1 hypothetical protein [Fredinandcohnia sp. QZ13]
MPYILEKANVLKNNKVITCSILIKNHRVDYMKENLKRLSYMKTNLSQYLLTPGHVMINYSFTKEYSFQSFKKEMTENYLRKGCTTLLVISDVKNEHEIAQSLNSTKHFLLNSPIDYYLGIRIPLESLTPSFLVACRRKKIPVIIVTINKVEDLFNVPWGWIRESYHSYRIPIIPDWKMKEKTVFNSNRKELIWKEITDDNRIPTIPLCPTADVPLSIDFLKKSGIYPDKGDIRVGGELDYNLYEHDSISYSVDEKPTLDYHNLIPTITMHKGNFTKVGTKVYFRSGFGNECKVKKPGYFVSSYDHEVLVNER